MTFSVYTGVAQLLYIHVWMMVKTFITEKVTLKIISGIISFDLFSVKSFTNTLHLRIGTHRLYIGNETVTGITFRSWKNPDIMSRPCQDRTNWQIVWIQSNSTSIHVSIVSLVPSGWDAVTSRAVQTPARACVAWQRGARKWTRVHRATPCLPQSEFWINHFD